MRDPEVFLLDEPLSNLDAALRVQMRLEIIKLHQSLKATMVYVTHDQIEAMTMADRIAVSNQGRLEQLGPPLELYDSPHNLFVAGFIGSPNMNFINTQVESVFHEGVTVKIASDATITLPVDGTALATGSVVTLGVRPEHLGGEKLSHAHIGDGKETEIKASGHAPAKQGETLKLTLRATLCHLFDEQGNAVAKQPASRS